VKIAVGIGAPSFADRHEWEITEQVAIEADRMGADFCWSSEAWGLDAVAPIAHLAARTQRIRVGTGIMQISARVPATTAMTAMTMATISGDRFSLGLGVSGPRVVEALQGASFDRPVERLSEYLDILELAFAGQPLRYEGRHYQLPRAGSEEAPFALTGHGTKRIPIYLATLAPRGLELLGARADGWLASGFIPEAGSAYLDPIRAGAERAGRRFEDIDLQAGGPVLFGDDVQALLPRVKKALAFRLGAMGPPGRNFYNLAYRRAGYVDEATEIQRLWLASERAAAVEAVSDEMATISSFVGTDDMIRDRVRAFRRAGITTLWPEFAGGDAASRIDALGRFIDLVRAASDEMLNDAVCD
jgi:F420-dependent oxidoreductase-like protein